MRRLLPLVAALVGIPGVAGAGGIDLDVFLEPGDSFVLVGDAPAGGAFDVDYATPADRILFEVRHAGNATLLVERTEPEGFARLESPTAARFVLSWTNPTNGTLSLNVQVQGDFDYVESRGLRQLDPAFYGVPGPALALLLLALVAAAWTWRP